MFNPSIHLLETKDRWYLLGMIHFFLIILLSCTGQITDETQAKKDGGIEEEDMGSPSDRGTTILPKTDQPLIIRYDIGVKLDGRIRDKAITTGCPWGASVPESLSVGMSTTAHIAGGNADEKIVFARMNQYRKGNPLIWDDCLADLARSHSQYMAIYGYTSHGSKTNSGFLINERAAAAGYKERPLDEDCLTGNLEYWLGNDVGNLVDQRWMTDGHSAPILNCKKVGVGIVRITSGGPGNTVIMATADFVCP